MIALAMYPDKQRKMQVEINRVIGARRLPEIRDKAALPYVGAVIKEVFRWHPTLPLGTPHFSTIQCLMSFLNDHAQTGIARRTAEDDMYEGYFIPKSTIVLPNIWCVHCLSGSIDLLTPDRAGPSRSSRMKNTTRRTSSQSGS